MWKTIASGAKELFFPKRCFFCKKYGALLCGDCQALFEVSAIHYPNREIKYLSDIYSACSYENKYAQKLIRQLKYEPFCKEFAAPLADLIADHFKLAEIKLDSQDSVIAPIPLANKRLRWRGFNQAEAIASELGKLWQIPVAKNCLLRIRETATQTDLDKSRRRENIKNAFICPDSAPIKNKIILLVDDVITTGATMEECARVLSRRNAKQVIGITLARAAK